MNKLDCLKNIVRDSKFFVQDGCWLSILYCNEEDGDDTFRCCDENSQEEYDIRYDEIDLIKDKFYELKEVDFSEYEQLKGIS